MKKPIILSEDNIAGYFNTVSYFKKKRVAVTNAVEIKSYTNSGYVFELSLKGFKYPSLYLKQTRGLTKNNFELPAQRVVWEAESAKKFNKIVGKKVAPEIIFVDKANNVLFMEDVLRGGERCVYLFKNGDLRPQLGAQCGQIFGAVHGKTYGMKKHNFGKNDYWYNLLTDFIFINFYLVGFKKVFGEAAAQIILQESKNTTHAFCHMDPLIKNVFFHKNTVRIVDYEQATKWDPAYDLGSFLTPWALALSSRKLKPAATAFINNFFKSYNSALPKNKIGPTDREQIRRRALRYTATTILHHTQGKDVYDFFRPYKKIAKKEVMNLIGNKPSQFVKDIRLLYGVKQKLL